MKIDINKNADNDIDILLKSLRDSGISNPESSDFEMITPYEVHPGTNNPHLKNKVMFNVYPALLSYYDKKVITEPWICFRFSISLENDKETRNTPRIDSILSYVANKIKQNSIKPFYDEDAVKRCFSHPDKDNKRLIFKFYMNPDYKRGMYGNHALN